MPLRKYAQSIAGMVFGDSSTETIRQKVWLLYLWAYRHFQQYFSYVVVASFIGERYRSTRRKPPTCRK
jgi:hypothetical protein